VWLPGVQIYVFKALDQNGMGRTSDVINALQRVTPEISGLSLGAAELISCALIRGRHPSPLSSGKLMVFSAGNYCTTSSATRAGGRLPPATTTPPADIKFPPATQGFMPWAPPMRRSGASFSRSGPAMRITVWWPPGEHFFHQPGGGIWLDERHQRSTPHVYGAVALRCSCDRSLL